MNKFLILKFRNAKLFRNGKGCKDKIFDLTETRDRANEKQFVEPITIFQISNLIHVLFGERPVPTNRTVLYPKNDYYFEKAKESYLKVVGTKRFNKTKNVEEFVSETLMVKKALHNSWNPNVLINWEIVTQYVGIDNITWVKEMISNLIGVENIDLPFSDIRELILKSDNNDFFEELKDNGLTGLVAYILDGKAGWRLTSKKETGLTVNSGIQKVVVLSGEIIIPVNDDDIEKFRNSKGCATILDGGMVWVDSLVDYASEDGFEKVSEISIEKY